MQIAKHKVVTIEYTLKDPQGELLDTSKGGEPLVYLQGVGGLIPGLETALEGKSTGEELQVTVQPEQAYGAKDQSLVQAVPRRLFGENQNIQRGMRFRAESGGASQVVTVVDITDDQVTIDANHPLAGVTLNFDVKVLDVRDATEEEIQHRHVHGPGGHHHH